MRKYRWVECTPERLLNTLAWYKYLSSTSQASTRDILVLRELRRYEADAWQEFFAAREAKDKHDGR